VAVKNCYKRGPTLSIISNGKTAVPYEKAKEDKVQSFGKVMNESIPILENWDLA